MKSKILIMMTALLLLSFSVSAVSAVSKEELKIATWEDISTFDPAG